MTTFVRTLDGGEFAAGFQAEDVGRIQLGGLEPMTIQQFVSYAVATFATGIVPTLSQEQKQIWAAQVSGVIEELAPIGLRRVTGKYIGMSPEELFEQRETADPTDMAELGLSINALMWESTPAVHYRINPFEAREDGQAVNLKHEGSTRYTVEPEEFFNLICTILQGGLWGWAKYGVYQEVKDAAATLYAALSR